MNRKIDTDVMVKTAMLGAISFVLYFALKAPISPPFPVFLEINLSDIPALIGALFLGPLPGVIIVTIKIALKLVFGMSSTAAVGEFADLLIGIAYVLPAGLYYKKSTKTAGAALIALAIGSVASMAMAAIANAAFLVDFYVELFFGGNKQIIVDLCHIMLPNATMDTFMTGYIFLIVLPFNLIRCVLGVAVTMLLYKRIMPILSRRRTAQTRGIKNTKPQNEQFK